MPFRSTAAVVSRNLAASLVVGVGLLTFGAADNVRAVDTGVNAVICGQDAPGASIDITQPNDDSIVNQPASTFRGTVANATQIEVEIDGQYDSTVTIAYNQATFAIDLSLTEGTHTVKLTANDVCQVKNASDSIVITYQPVDEPSDGGSTPTDVDGGTVVDPDGPAPTPSDGPWFERSPLLKGVTEFVADVGRLLGIDRPFVGDGPVLGIIRTTSVLGALFVIAMAGALAPWVQQRVPRLRSPFGMTTTASHRLVTWLLRLSAFIVIVLASLV